MKTAGSLRIASTIVIGLSGANIHAAGFQLQEQNASGIGNSYAGSGAIAENASTIFFNPAGMTRLPGVNISLGATAIKPSFRFSDEGSTAPGGAPAVGGDGGDAGSIGVVPNAYISWELTPRWYAGLGISAPFGLMTDYNEGWRNRHHSEKFSIESINVNPSIAYKVNDQLSIGAGVSWMHLNADYRLATAVPLPGLGIAGDLSTKVKMKGDGWGWNLGLMYQMTPATRIGLSYRSTVKIRANGDTTLTNRSVPGPIYGAGTAAGLIPNGDYDARTRVTLPDTALLSIVHDLNSQWQLLADLQWTGWSSLQSLDIENSGVPDKSLTLKFRDTWRVAFGANYKHNAQWTFKGGVAYDQSPIRNSRYRLTSLPDNDRVWLSAGVQYNVSKHTTIDVGYAHMFLQGSSMNNDTDLSSGVAKGEYDSGGDLIGIQVSHRF